MPYIGRMTFLTDAGNEPAGIKITVRHRLRIAREEMYPDLPIATFSKDVLGVGKNMAAAYESKNGTRIENMKDMVLRRWAEVCGVSLEWLKEDGPDGTPGEGVHPPGLEPGTHWLWDNVIELGLTA